MKGHLRLLFFFVFGALLVCWGCSHHSGTQVGEQSGDNSSIAPFLGRWDLTIKAPAGDLPSWIEVSEAQGKPKVVLVGIADHATVLTRVALEGDQLTFLSPKGEEGFGQDTLFRGRVVGSELEGTASGPTGALWSWTGRRAPTLEETAPPTWGKPIKLFNGRNLVGWTFSDPGHAGVWKVEHHELVKSGQGSEIITTSKFKDFKLHVEFNCGPRANSGVYLRGRYEVQIETDSASEPASHHTAGVYGFLAPDPELPRKADVWQSFDITLVGRTVTVVQNGQTVIDHQEIPGITGGALDSDEGSPGPIYLQGSEEGRVAFRNIVITPAT